jgi:hypothetical protein
MPRIRALFGGLVLTQAAHSIEEYAGRLWETFPPARFVSGLVSSDLEQGFLILNVALIAFGGWCFLWPVSRGWAGSRRLIAGWAAVEALNGTVHLLWSLRQIGYMPGVATAPVLLALAIAIFANLRDGPPAASN